MSINIPIDENKTGWPLHTRMLMAFVIGITFGLIANVFFSGSGVVENIIGWVTEPVGKLFINTLKMLVVPLVFELTVKLPPASRAPRLFCH